MQHMTDIDDLRGAWKQLAAQMERTESIQLQLLRETRLAGARRSLRGLYIGMTLQLLLGVGLVLLGVACWTRNVDVAGLLGTWAWSAWSRHSGRTARLAASADRTVSDGTDGIRRGQRMLDEIARFERD